VNRLQVLQPAMVLDLEMQLKLLHSPKLHDLVLSLMVLEELVVPH
jgi:hypothetical protein